MALSKTALWQHSSLLQLERHQPYETHNIRPRPRISGPDVQYQAPKLGSDSGHVQSDFLPVQRGKFMNISINKIELNYFSSNCVLFHSQFVKYLVDLTFAA